MKGNKEMNIKNIILKTGTFCLAAILGAACFSVPEKVNASPVPGSGLVKLSNDILKVPKVTEAVLNPVPEKKEYKSTYTISAESYETDRFNAHTVIANKTGTWYILCNYGGGRVLVKDSDAEVVVGRTYVSKNSAIKMDLTKGETYTLTVDQINTDIGLLIIEPKDVIDVSNYNYISDQTEFKGMTNTYTYTPSETGKYAFVLDSVTSPSKNPISIYVKDANGNTLRSATNIAAGKMISADLTKGQKYTITVTGNDTTTFGLSYNLEKKPDITGYTRIDDTQSYNGCINTYSYKAPYDGAYYFALESRGSALSLDVKDSNGKSIKSLDFVTTKLGAKVDLKANETYTISVGCGTASGNTRSSYTLYVTPQKPTLDVTNYDKIEDSFTFVYQKNKYLLRVDEKGEYTFNFDLTDAKATFVYFYIYDMDGNTLLSKEYRRKVSPNISKTLEAGSYILAVRGEDDFGYAMTIQKPNKETVANDQILDFVRRLYIYVLDREPEQEGLKFWSGELFNFRSTGAEVAQGFIFSAEFESRGTSDEQFLTILYKTFFNREPDDAGMAFWLGQLSSHTMDRTAVANGFIFSQEWADTCASYGIRSGGNIKAKETINPTDATYAFVERMYTTALGRDFDSEGREYWAQGLANYNMTGESVGVAFFLSEEMVSYNLSNEEFVNRLYLTFMDRESDPEGAAYWIDLLSTGTSRETVVYGFTRSAEFIGKCEAARIIPYV